MIESLFAHVMKQELHLIADGSTKSKNHWISFTNEMFDGDKDGPGPLLIYRKYSGQDSNNKLRTLVLKSAEYFAQKYDEKKQRNGLEADFSVSEDLGKQIVFGRQQAVEAAKGEHEEREEMKQNACRQQEMAEEFIGLVSPH